MDIFEPELADIFEPEFLLPRFSSENYIDGHEPIKQQDPKLPTLSQPNFVTNNIQLVPSNVCKRRSMKKRSKTDQSAP